MSNQKPAPMDSVMINDVSFSHQDMFDVIDAFYTKVQNDELLKEPFSSVHDWPEHIDRLTHFWWGKFGGQPYMFTMYNPVVKHFHSGFDREKLTRWLALFHETLNEKLSAQQAQIWKLISERMGESLSLKNEMYKKEYEKN